MNRPKISIIVPVYKVPEPYLRKCMESCLAQTMPDIEVIAVDDGSPDNCGKILDEYAAKDPRVKVIHKPNAGPAAARNSGYDAATGLWHTYVDGDDYLALDACEKLMNVAQRHPGTDIVIFRNFLDLDGTQIADKWTTMVTKGHERVFEGHSECCEVAINSLSYKYGIADSWGKMINTDFARKYGLCHYPKLRQGSEGGEFVLRAFYHAQKIVYTDIQIYHYRFVLGSITKSINEKNTKYLIQCYTRMSEIIEDFDRKEDFRMMLNQRIVYVLIAIAMNTYFHPDRTDSLTARHKKYAKVIKDTPIFRDAVKACPFAGIDKFRKVALFFIKSHLYFCLQPIASLKQYFIKKGKYNY